MSDGVDGERELPAGWAWSTLEGLLACEPRAITDGPFGSNLKSAHYTDSGARVIRLQNVGDGEFRDERAYISREHFETLRAHEAVEGDLLLASLGETLPRVAILPKLDEPSIVKADVIRARLHPEILTKWVYYALLAPQTRAYAGALIKGVGRPRLGMAAMKAIPVPVPPLAEQYRIVEALEEQLSRLDAAELAVKRTLRRQVWLVGAVRDRFVRADGDLPDGWSWRTLRDVVDRVEAGKSFRCDPRPAADGEWGVIKVSAMTWGEFQQEEQKAVPVGRNVDERYEIGVGDILVSRANTPDYVGAPVLVRKTRPRLLLSDKSLRLVPAPGVSRDWLITALSAPVVRRQITAKATGSKDSMRNISQKDLLSVRLPVPPASEQSRVAERADETLSGIGGMAREAQRSLVKASALRKAILRRAFSGRLVGRDPNDEPASVLIDRISAERAARQKAKRTRKAPAQRAAEAAAPEPTPAPALAVQQEFEL